MAPVSDMTEIIRYWQNFDFGIYLNKEILVLWDKMSQILLDKMLQGKCHIQNASRKNFHNGKMSLCKSVTRLNASRKKHIEKKISPVKMPHGQNDTEHVYMQRSFIDGLIIS